MLWDLRIFGLSNLIVTLLAAGLVYRATPNNVGKLSWISFLLLAAIALCVHMYVDSLSFFTILFDFYFGWSYPAALVFTFLYLYVRCRPFPKAGSRRASRHPSMAK